MARQHHPVIGIPACLIDLNGRPVHRVGAKYMHSIAELTNCVPLMVPAFGDIDFAEEIIGRLDGLFLTGSASNVEPHRYGGPPSREGTAHDPARDGTCLALIRAAVEAGVPVFAVCRGIQELNVALGGSLHQNVHELPGKNEHRMNRAADTDERFSPRHPIHIAPGGMLSELTGGSEIEMVNSLHAQAIDRLGESLDIEAISDDGVVEAVSANHPHQFVLGVQWHPEYPVLEAYPLSRKLFSAFDQAVANFVAAGRARPGRTRAA
jgi:putative glutamine amidotransferase